MLEEITLEWYKNKNFPENPEKSDVLSDGFNYKGVVSITSA